MTATERHRAMSGAVTVAVDEVNWCLDERQPATPQPAENVGGPPGLTASSADLVAWWRWRYASLNAECCRLEGLLARALCEAQSYREIGQAALGQLHDLTREVARQRETIARLREELKTARKGTGVLV